MHVFGWWEVGISKMHNVQTPQLGFAPGTLLLWGNSANHHTTVQLYLRRLLHNFAVCCTRGTHLCSSVCKEDNKRPVFHLCSYFMCQNVSFWVLCTSTPDCVLCKEVTGFILLWEMSKMGLNWLKFRFLRPEAHFEFVDVEIMIFSKFFFNSNM